MKKNSNYVFEPLRLASMLQTAEIPFEMRPVHDGYQVCYPSVANCISDAVCHDFSYGHEKCLLEIMGLVDEEEVGDTVEGWLTAEQVFERWAKHWTENQGA